MLRQLSRKFVADESGATAIEYGLIAAGIAVAIIAAGRPVGRKPQRHVRRSPSSALVNSRAPSLRQPDSTVSTSVTVACDASGGPEKSQQRHALDVRSCSA